MKLTDLPDQQALYLLLCELDSRQNTDRLRSYEPYPKQLEFHAAGATFRERLLRAGNQNGKTYPTGMEVAMHLTGMYPDWWPGRRWDRPIIAWAGSDTGETTRDNPQRQLCGLVGEFGTGSIPKRLMGTKKLAMGTADLYDYVKVKHVSGGWSTLRFKPYAQGRQKWQGPPVDMVWYDEEPPAPIYDEGLARTIATGGMVALSFTPLLGMSEVVRRFLMETSGDRSDTNLTIEDAQHIPADERAKIIAGFPAHEREARAKGVPTLGSGRIFPVPESELQWQTTALPPHVVYLGGLDFGWDHPTAAVKCAWDKDSDTFYVITAYKRSEQTPLIHAGALRPLGDWLPWAWPHDGLQHDKGSGKKLSDQYRDQGLKMFRERATFPDGSFGVEAGLMEMLDAMQTGRFKVAAHLENWFEEYRLYHRKDGKVEKIYDDLLSATRYAWMMRRFAVPEGGEQYAEETYDYDSREGGWMS
jgi:phage terminase large subunit-like protein